MAELKRRVYTEWEVEVWSKSRAKTTGWLVRKFTSPAHRAAPDDMFSKGGRIFFVEFKAPLKYPTPSQQHEHKLMKEAGLDVYTINTREDFAKLLETEEAKLKEAEAKLKEPTIAPTSDDWLEC